MIRTYGKSPLLVLCLLLGISQPVFSQSEATAEYSVTFSGNWTTSSTPGGVVGGAHFTTIAGGKHNSSVSFWKSGEAATSGLESLAEIGATSGFISEINASSHTDASFTSGVGGGGTGTSTFSLTVKKTHPLITLGSMIGPSPDWFVGLSGYSLLDSSSNWVSSVTVNLFPYDAGTEDGNEFSLSNPATSPQGVITSLKGVGKFSNEPMARISFTRQDAPPPQTAPTITAIERSSNASQYTNADSVTWSVTFSEAVQNVSTDDFVVYGTTATVTSASLVSGSSTQYQVVVSGGNLANLNATISLGLSRFQNITNSSSLDLSTDLPTSSETYVIDNAAPHVTAVLPSSADESPFTATITFNETIRSDSFADDGDVTSENANVSAPSGSGSTFRVAVTPDSPSQAGSITLNIASGAAIDLAGNPSSEHEATIDYAPDLTRMTPVVNSVVAITPNGLYHTGEEIEIGVSFSQSVTVRGTPTLELQFDNSPRSASYDRGSRSDSLVFSYTLATGDAVSDLDYVDTQALDLAGGSIIGVGGLAANLTLPVPGTSRSLSQSSNIRTSGHQDTQPSFGGARIDDQVLMMNQQVDEIKLPVATTGDAPIRYDLEPSLPPGLKLDAATQVISGTPTDVFDLTTFTWSATDADGDVTRLTFTIVILPELPLQFPSSALIPDQVFLQNDAIEPVGLPTARGGDGELIYSLIPELPPGLSVDLEARRISGTPTEALSQSTFTWRVMDDAGAMVDLMFDITILEDFQPAFDKSLTTIDERFVQNSPITPFTLPSAASGNGKLTYELVSKLPEGLVLDATTFEITGIPSAPTSRMLLVWTVTDEDGDSASFNFFITVLEDTTPSFADDASIEDYEFISDSAIEPIQLPNAMGGNGSLVYSLSPDLPSGLELEPMLRQIKGMPTSVLERTQFTWTVSDEDGDSAELTFYITVIQDTHPVFDDQAVDKEFVERTPIDAFMLPLASGGNGQLNYELTPELPEGIDLDPETAVISGTPLEVVEEIEYSWTATDEDGDTAEQTFTITVEPRIPLHFPASTLIADQVFLQNDAIAAVELPSAMGGFGELTYSLSPELPSGLTLDLEARQISGTPSGFLDETEFTWRVTDEDGESAELTFSITVLEDLQPVFDVTVSPIDETFIQHSSITPFTLLRASGGNGRLTYELEPTLPEGLILDATSFEVRGIPSIAINRTLFTWTVSDEDGDSASFNFYITVLEDVAPFFAADASIPDQEFISDSAIEPFRLPTAMGGNRSLSYSLSPQLPNGLQLFSLLYEISGTPTTAQEKTKYVWTVADADGDSVSLEFYLTVIQDTQPTFSASIDDKVFVMGMPIESFNLPRASGGNGQLKYELTPQLENGLSFNAASSSISGTPIAEAPASTYSWTVTDIDGDTATLTFSITVNPALPRVVGSIANVQLVVGGSSQMVDASTAIEGRVDAWGVNVGDSAVVSVTLVPSNILSTAGVLSTSGVLTLSPLFEGRSSVTVTAYNATGSVQISFTVNVVTDSVEIDQIDTALSLKAGAILSSAMNVFKHRAHSHGTSNESGEVSTVGYSSNIGLNESHWSIYQSPSHDRFGGVFANNLVRTSRLANLSYGNDFVPLNFTHTSTRWRVWGAIDLQNFSSDAPQNEIDGSLSSLYLGTDLAVNENVFAGLAVARHGGSSSYEFSSSTANGAGEIDMTLLSFYPYLQAGDGQRFSMFLVGGIGYGDSQIDRRHATGSDLDSDTDMTLFAGGFDYVVLRRANIDFSIVGDAGVATLTTEADSGVLTGKDSASSKSSIGGSASFSPQIEGGSLATSVDVRLATGAEGDESGSGFEIGGNLNFNGDHIDFMLDARTTSRSANADVQRSSISARLRYKARTDGSGLTVRLRPRWQDGSLTAIDERFDPSIQSNRFFESFASNRNRSLEAEIGYGFWINNGSAMLEPRFAWQRMSSDEMMIKLGTTWRLAHYSRTTPLLGVDLLRNSTGRAGDSFGFVAKIGVPL